MEQIAKLDSLNYLHWQIGALLITCATSVHMYTSNVSHPLAALQHVGDTHNGMEREREVHPSHGNHGVRARYATVAGGT